MIIVNINKEQIFRAEHLYDFNALKGSIMKGESNIYGALGEVLVCDFHKIRGDDVIYRGDYDYDIIINGYKVDVKTKRTNVRPMPHYYCSVTDTYRQGCDYYYFVRILEDLSEGYILGYIERNYIFNNGLYFKKGDRDGDFIFKSDSYNVMVKDLKLRKN